MRIPRAIQNLIESFERLPGVGPKSAQRLTFYLLHVPQEQLDMFARAVTELKKNTKICSTCYNIAETNPCDVCSDIRRDTSIVCVVEQPLDILALEKSGTFKGIYHALHGKIDPLNNIGPDEIFIAPLLKRIAKETQETEGTRVKEVILATNPTMEGEGTAMYLAKQIKIINPELKITRIGRGLPIGADLEYADSVTLQRAMEGRLQY